MKDTKKKTIDPISVPKEAMIAVGNIRKQIAELEAHFGSYLTGLKQGMGVPQDWQLDLQKGVFVPPQEKKKQ
jgi:hypothetical protein